MHHSRYRILFFTFSAIIFTFYVFYSTDPSASYRDYFSNYRSLVVNNLTRLNLEQLFNNVGNFFSTCGGEPLKKL